jgi:hypothetical protein
MMRRVVASCLAILLTVGIGWFSSFGWEADRGSHAAIRLAWRTRSARVQECRRPTEAELAGVPIHMQRREICEGRVLAYELRVVLDSNVVVDETLHGGGARKDRPIVVFQEFEVSPGVHMVEVTFRREDGGEVVTENLALTPALLEFSTELTLGKKEITLITYDPGKRGLVVEGYGLSLSDGRD